MKIGDTLFHCVMKDIFKYNTENKLMTVELYENCIKKVFFIANFINGTPMKKLISDLDEIDINKKHNYRDVVNFIRKYLNICSDDRVVQAILIRYDK